MKVLKKYRVVIFLLICLILGFSLGPLFYNGYMGDLFNSFKIRWYYHILVFLGTVFVTLSLHELTHHFSFMASKYKSDMIIIFFFIFYRNKDYKWRLKVDFKLLLLGGGMVVPNLGVINNDDDYNKAKTALSKSLLAAPLFTLISSLLLFFVTLIFFYKSMVMVPITFYTLVISIFYTYLSSLESDQAYGDFKAFKKVKNDDLFAQTIIIQYIDELTPYLDNKFRNNIKDQLPIKRDLSSISFFQALLDHAIYDSDELDFLMYEKVYYYAQYPNSFRRLLNSPMNLGLGQYIIFYLDRLNFKDDSIKLKNIFNEKINEFKLNEKVKTYLTKQTDHILGLSDESEYINNPKNMVTGLSSLIFGKMDFFIEAEKTKNNGYKELILESNI